VLKRFFKKEKAMVYLGCVAVAPRSDIKRHLDQWAFYGREDLDSSLRLFLEEIFDLPSAKDVENPTKTDLGLDIVVPKFQSGDIWDVSLGDIGFPVAWRPKIEIGSRLYSLATGKTVHTATVKVKMPWREYFSRLFTWRALLRFKPMFDSTDMNRLLAKACMQLITKLRKVA
jgi:hypothetical protein